MKIRAQLRSRGLYLRQVYPDGEPIGIVEVHDPIPPAGDLEYVRARPAEERISFVATDQAIVAGTANQQATSRATDQGVVAALAVKVACLCCFRSRAGLAPH